MKFFHIFIIFLPFPSTSPITLDCKFFDGATQGYQCSANLEIFYKFDRSISTLTGRHSTNKTNSDVKFFDLSDKIVKFFPKNLQNFFPNLSTIHLEKAHLSEIKSEDLQPFGDGLTELWLGQNDIEVIEVNLFDFTPNIKAMSLSTNKIKFIADGAFESLQQLTRLDMNLNSCGAAWGFSRAAVLTCVAAMEKSCKDGSVTATTSEGEFVGFF